MDSEHEVFAHLLAELKTKEFSLTIRSETQRSMHKYSTYQPAYLVNGVLQHEMTDYENN